MIIQILWFIICSTSLHCATERYPYKALVIVPVADLIGQPMHSLYASDIEDAYNHIPLCGGNKNRWHSCARTEQLLFNEIVDVIEKHGPEVKVNVSHAYYVTEKTPKKKHTEYWTLERNLIPLSKLITSGIDQRMLPVSFDFNNETQQQRATIALTQPYYNSDSKMHFSAGTRFICAKTSPGQTYFNVFAYNPQKKVMQKIKLPASICVTYTHLRTQKEMRTLFVNFAKQWAEMQQGYVPYAWGGCSIVYPYSGTFCEQTRIFKNQTISFFDYPDIHHNPHTGLDCSGLVRRAAQLAGIPYFYKNTYTIAQYMEPIKEKEHLQIGDLIWAPGHVMIVSDLDRNLLIEARSYFQGYGKVHEIALHKVFKNINTYADLETHFFDKKPIERIDNEGIVRNVLPHFLLLNLGSVFKKT